jgi:hypothetical protein
LHGRDGANAVIATRDVLWAAWDGRGFEHLRLQMDAQGVRADSLIIAVDEGGRPYRARYRLECDAGWTTRRALVKRPGEPAGVLDLRTDGHGRWTDAATGAALPLDGCVDVDIFPSPFTNTLPVRRLPELAVGRPVALRMAWVLLPDLTVRVAPQEYTLLERRADGSRWRFRSLDSDFTVELEMDADGVVRDYPDLARRV